MTDELQATRRFRPPQNPAVHLRRSRGNNGRLDDTKPSAGVVVVLSGHMATVEIAPDGMGFFTTAFFLNTSVPSRDTLNTLIPGAPPA